MDFQFHGGCMGKLVGPAGGGGLGGGGPNVSAQFRVLPNSLPLDALCTDWERIQAVSHAPSLSLKISSPGPHRTFSPEPLKISDEFIGSPGNSPVQEATSGFLHDSPASLRRPRLVAASSPSVPAGQRFDKKTASWMENDPTSEYLGVAGVLSNS